MRTIGLLLSLLAFMFPAFAEQRSQQPVISIIIDDMGDRAREDRRAVALPGPVACAFLPFTPHAERLAQAAYDAGKEVMLHLPMQAIGRDHGPWGVDMDMHREQFFAVVAAGLDSIPHVSGVNNHMGSLLTRHPGHMRWLMEKLVSRDEELFFVDSRTTAQTVAEQLALEFGVPVARRHVFLDHDPRPEAIDAQFDLLLRLARQRGRALAIGHPYPATLDVLEARLARLDEEQVRLIPVREFIALDEAERRLVGVEYHRD